MVPWGCQEDAGHGGAWGEPEHPREKQGVCVSNFWHVSSQPWPPRPLAQLPPRITELESLLGERGGVLSCGAGEGRTGSVGLMDGCRKPPWGGGRPSLRSPQGCCQERPRSWHRWQCTWPGHLGPDEARGGEQEASWPCVWERRGQPVPCPAVLPQHLISALARSLGGGSGCLCCAVRRERAAACVPALCLGGREEGARALGAGWFCGSRAQGAALLGGAAVFQHGCVAGLRLSLLLSPLMREKRKSSALLSLLEIQTSALQMPGGSAPPLARQPSPLNTNCF